MQNKKNNFHKITVSEMAPHVHNFLPNENKTEKIYHWLKNWIRLSLECKKIHPYDLLPSKADLACHIGVSQGTIQNVFRLLENEGFLESKQKIGTFIKKLNTKETIEKLTSKREFAIEIIKRYILENNYNVGEELISIRKLSLYTGYPNTTLRSAVISLIQDGILKKEGNLFIIKKIDFNIEKIKQETLVEKTADNIKKYLYINFKTGDKIPPNIELARFFKVSVKTINDAIKQLEKEGLLFSRRGQYGTIIINDSSTTSISYLYIKFEQKIRQLISEKYNIGDKLPTIAELAKFYETSEKTIKKSLDNLVEDGYITFVRGRYGGTFVTDIPQASNEAYKWLAINTDYLNN